MAIHRNKFFVSSSLIALVALGVSSTMPSPGRFKNLQVLPKDITEHQMDSIMKSYNQALGVNCKFCHIPMKGIPDSLDYAADGEPMKEEGRKMIRMTININKNWFYYDTAKQPAFLNVVICNTCHRGEAFPEH